MGERDERVRGSYSPFTLIIVGCNLGMNQQPTIYELAGGDAPFRRLIDAFYARVEHEPLLRPLYPANLAASKEHLFLFVTQYFGGPPRYNALRGHPRLRMRHAPFRLDEAARNRWVALMDRALDGAQLPEAAVQVLRPFFHEVATFLRNT